MSTSAEPAPGQGDGRPAVVLEGLVKRFGAKRALAGIDLVLRSGHIVGIVGPDGAGKTTLLRSLAGLLEIEARRAEVLGHDLLGDPTELKRSIGYVPQSFGLQRDLSVIENLRFTARLHRLPEADFASRSSALLERTGLAAFVDRPAGALSGGMKQKLAVSNALLVEPAILLLDEPTAGVDVSARAEIAAMLAAERRRALVVLSTSYLEEAAACDRLVYLDEGRVVADGTPEELRTRVSLALYRAWGEDSRAAAREARRLPYVVGARASGRYARIEVRPEGAPDEPAVLDRLTGLPGAVFAERAPIDMETTLLALSREADTTSARPSARRGEQRA